MRARYQHVCLESLGFELPPEVVTSRSMEDRLSATYARFGVLPGAFEEQTGIRERRFFPPGLTCSKAAAAAGAKALAAAGRSATEVECLVSSSIDREYFEPSTACLVHQALGGAPGAMVFDVSNACVGFLNALATVANLIELGQLETALVVDAEARGVRASVESALARLSAEGATEEQLLSQLPTLTAGCGAVAAVLTRRERSRSGHRLEWLVARAASEYSWLSLGEIHGPGEFVMVTHAGAMLRKGVALLKATWAEAVEHFGADRFDHAFGHQVGAPHAQAVIKGLSLPPEKVHLTFPVLGNVGPAGLPLSLALAESEGKLKEGQRLSLLAAGSGLNSVVMGLVW